MQVEVSVFHGDKLVEKIGQRPVRLLPDGVTAAVVYRRSAYPLRRKDSTSGPLHYIDASDSACEKDNCPIAPNGKNLVFTGERDRVGISAKQQREAAPAVDWHLETNAYGHYVVFDGERSWFDRVVRRMRSSGIPYLRAAESYRPADNGRTYAWFIRLPLDFDDNVERLRARVDVALRAAAAEQTKPHLDQQQGPASPTPDGEVLARLRLRDLQIAALIVEQNQLKIQVNAEADRNKQLQQELEAAKRQQALDRQAVERAAAAQRDMARKADELARALREADELRDNMQRSHARLLSLLEAERSAAERRDRTRADADQSGKAALDQELNRARLQAQTRASEIQALQDDLARLRQGKAEADARAASLEKQMIEARGRIETLDREKREAVKARQQSAQMVELYEQEVEELRAATEGFKASVAEQLDPDDSSGREQRAISDTVAHMAKWLLPRVELDHDSIECVVDHKWYASARELWQQLRLINDYDRSRLSSEQQRWESVGKRGWKELRKHISDGVADDFVRIYMQQPTSERKEVRIRLFRKRERHQQDEFHRQLDERPWIPFKFAGRS